jgi:lysylphosphatidylglycerol synthetase-like protein (DUF2156 family)
MKRSPKTVTATLILILLNAAFWFVYAIFTIATNTDAATVSHVARWIFSFLALGTAAVLVVLFFLLRKRVRFAYFIALVVLALLAVLSLTDQVGWLDVFSLLLSLIPFVLLVKDNLYYRRLQ